MHLANFIRRKLLQKACNDSQATTDKKGDPLVDSVPLPLPPAPRRYGSVIRLRPEQYQRYRELHDHVWDGVLQVMTQANIRNFVIYYHVETGILFQHFEWIGHWKTACRNKQEETDLFQRDMQIIAGDPITRDWWKECEPCQEPFSRSAVPPSARTGSDDKDAPSWWSSCECVAYCGHWPMSYSLETRDPDFVTL
jgi:L-rhamnose mutarotase